MKQSILGILFVSVLLILVGFSPASAFATGVHGGGGGGGGYHGGGGGGGWGYHGGGGYGWHGGYGGWHGGYWGGGWRGGSWGWGYPSYCCGWGFSLSFSFGPYWGYGYPYGYSYGYAPYSYPYYYGYYPPYYYAPAGDPPASSPPSASNSTGNSVPDQPDATQAAPAISAPNSNPNRSLLTLSEAVYRSSTPSPSKVYGVTSAPSYSSASVERQYPATRAEVRNVIRALRAMPPAARQRQIDSGRYSNLSPEELTLVREAADVPSSLP